MYALDFRAMGSEVRAVLDSDDAAQASGALDRFAAWLARCERTLSRFDDRSELSRLNALGFVDHADELLWNAIDVACDAATSSDGLVTPMVLGALEAAGYDPSFELLELEQPGPHPAAYVADFRDIERDAATRSIRLPLGGRVDLGGTAKGWCADLGAAELARTGPALVSIGGDVAMSESRRGPWPVAIEDPRGSRAPLEVVALRRGGVATSGRDQKRWRRSGAWQHHIIDPRTGAPSRTDVWTASVIGPSALAAEVAAKRVMLDGCELGLRWIESRPDLAAIVVCEDGRVRRSARFGEHAWAGAA